MSGDAPGEERIESSGADPVPADDVEAAPENGELEADGTTPLHAASLLEVIGIGGSAGGLEGLLRFFRAIDGPTGAAYVVVLHLSPEHESSLAEILQRSTSMPVAQVTANVKVQPDHVYVISPGKHLSMIDGHLSVSDMHAPRGRRVAVDLFFRTLADSHGPKATSIVLSGGDGDGSIGLKRIKERGGLTIAQDPAEADHDSMPLAAIATGMVDWVLPVEDIPPRLAQYRENGRRLKLPPEESPLPVGAGDEEALGEVLAFLRIRNGHDFTYYKRATVLRRIARRMQVNACGTIPEYLGFLRTQPGETAALLQDLLISVTNFFRDREAFAVVEGMIPQLFKDKGPNDQVRVWVAGCATGEEAYSMAIMLCEHAAQLESPPVIQVFATDIDEAAIEAARDGSYPETIMADLSEERLRRFFTRESGRYRVRRSLREVVLFALHDLLKDAPFSRLDLVSCRNLLIYLNREAQKRVFDIFHFGLRPEGTLFLGSSESAEDASSLFSPLDKKHRLYSRRAAHRMTVIVPTGAPTLALSLGLNRPIALPPTAPASAALTGPATLLPPGGLAAVAQRGGTWSDLHFRLLERLSPPSLVVNRSHEIVHLSESAGQFIQVSGGEPSMNLLRMIHPMLRVELRAALFRAFKTASTVELERARVELNGVVRLVDISVHPAQETSTDFLLVVFRLHEEADADPAGKRALDADGVVRHLEEELDQMRTQWRETVEQYETSTEELKASNEELQAMNEELRSATEELETGREELQSINEELTTVNQELKSKVEELSRANSDLQNLMASTNIATIFLDRELRIKRFTPSTVALFNLIATDVGRPLSDLTHRLEYPGIAADAERVLDQLTIVEREVRNSEGNWFLARLLPYRTTEDQIGGVVLTCVDVSERKHATGVRRWLSAAVESSNDAIMTFTLAGDIISWNRGAEQIFGYTAEEMLGKSQAVLAPPEYQEEMRALVERLREGNSIGSFETVRMRKDGKRIHVSISASVMRSEDGEILGATAIAQDITVRKEALEELRQARDKLEERVEQRTAELKQRADQLRRLASELTRTEQQERSRMASLLHDHVQQLLVSAKMRVEGVLRNPGAEAEAELAQVISLLDESLESSRSLAVELSPPILQEGLAPALEWLGSVWMKEKYGLSVKLDLDRQIDAAGDEMRALVFLAVRELLFNVVKHAKVLEAVVELAANDTSTVRVTVKDGGKGFDLERLESAKPSGTGLGLFTVRERISMLGGTLELRSQNGRGVEAVILVPRGREANRGRTESRFA